MYILFVDYFRIPDRHKSIFESQRNLTERRYAKHVQYQDETLNGRFEENIFPSYISFFSMRQFRHFGISHKIIWLRALTGVEMLLTRKDKKVNRFFFRKEHY